jgi:localization factor PodJL
MIEEREHAGIGGHRHRARPAPGAPQAADDNESAYNPSLDEPWDEQAADALMRLYDSGNAGLAEPLTGDEDLQRELARLSQPQPQHVPAAGIGEGIDRTWLEARLAEVTRSVMQSLTELQAGSPAARLGERFDQLEQRVSEAIANSATRADVEGLRIVEAHVGELMAHAEETKGHVSRLIVIEGQLEELKSTISEERIARLLAAAMPTEDELSGIAETAAERVLARTGTPARQDEGAVLFAAAPDQRIGDVHDLLLEFTERHRRGEQDLVDALDTMQQAMQHILDRIDAIEVAQSALLDQAQPGDAPARHAPRTSPPLHDVMTAAQKADAAMAVYPGVRAGGERRAERQSPPVLDDALVLPESLPDATWRNLAANADLDRSLEAPDLDLADVTATRKARKVKPGWLMQRLGSRSVLLAASLAAFALAGFWLVSASKLPLPIETAKRTDQTTATSDTTTATLRPVTPKDALDSGAAQEPAGGPIGQDTTGLHTGQRTAPVGGEETQSNRSIDAPAASQTVQPPLGVVIEHNNQVLMSPDELARLRQRQRMASLSTRLGQQQAAESGAARDLATSATQRPATEAAPATIVEMPPIMIGPNSLRLAASKGDASAQFEVAARFAEGKGVKQDFVQAGVWYQRAAMQGLAAAQYRLATLYERGIGMQKDPARARVWYKRAAEQGSVKAMHNLAVLSASLETPDYTAAVQWFTQAAEHGLADSQYNLAVLYEDGRGVGKDFSIAYKWYALAAGAGDKEAMKRRELLKLRIGSAAIQAVEREVAAWQPRAPSQMANDAHLAGQAWKHRASDTTE